MVKERPLREFLRMIEDRTPFSISRWGKSEWQVLFGECNGFIPKDGYWYFPQLCRDLTAVLTSRPEYLLGLNSEAVDHFGDRVSTYLAGCDLTDLAWSVNAMSADTPDRLKAVIGAVSRVPFLLVGPPHLHRVRSLVRYRSFVDVPPRNAYLCRADIVRNVLAALDDYREPVLISISAGVTTPLIIDDLYQRVGHEHQFVDFGGFWEPFVHSA